MNVLAKLGLFVVGVYGLVAIGKRSMQLSHLQDKLEYTIGAKIHTVKNGKLIINASINFMNPTEVNTTITKPTMRLFTVEPHTSNGNETYKKGELIAYSQPSSEKINISAKQSISISTFIEFPIASMPFINMVTKLGSNVLRMIKSIIITGKIPANGLGVKLLCEAIFDIDNIKDFSKTKIVSI